jgi:hypothetical protein
VRESVYVQMKKDIPSHVGGISSKEVKNILLLYKKAYGDMFF